LLRIVWWMSDLAVFSFLAFHIFIMILRFFIANVNNNIMPNATAIGLIKMTLIITIFIIVIYFHSDDSGIESRWYLIRRINFTEGTMSFKILICQFIKLQQQCSAIMRINLQKLLLTNISAYICNHSYFNSAMLSPACKMRIDINDVLWLYLTYVFF